jgi:hypothetical protein
MAKERAAVLSAVAGQVAAQMSLVGWGCCSNGRGLLPVRRDPLPGRPMVRAIRFSSVEPDATASWFKTPIDVMLPPRKRGAKFVAGLGLLRDDRPSALELRSWWERVPKGRGFCVVELWSGEATP